MTFKLALKYLFRLFLLTLLALSIYLINLFFMKPFSIDHFLAKETFLEIIDSPESMTYIGIFDKYNWLTGHASKLTIPSQKKLDRDKEKARKILDILESYEDENLSDIQRASKKIAVFDAENTLLRLETFPFHDYVLNQIGGAHIDMVEFMTDTHPIRNLAEAEAYIERVRLFEKVFEGHLYELNGQKAIDFYAPEFVYERVINQLDEFLNYSFEEHPIYTEFDRKIKDLDSSGEQKIELRENLKRAIQESINKAFRMMKDFLVSTQAQANNNHGLWSQPNGDKYYELRIRTYTTTDYTPQEIHDMGLSEVGRISNRMKTILMELGYNQDKSVGALMNELNEDPQFLYDDTPDRKQIAIKDYSKMVDEAYVVLEDYFHTMPKSKVIVKAVPEYSEKTAAGGYYKSPALDGSRPGVFYANLYDIKQTPKYGMKTLAYHEAIPGHHHQIAHSLENEDLTYYRKFGYRTSAFSEGWALYAEQLALEVGLADNPMDELGILQSELFRAVRLVVDTGMHYKKWTREKAMAYMKAKTGMSDTEVRVEIERYIVWPAQALSYKVGMIKILELRKRAQEALGKKFNIKDFHSALLDHGSPPLFIVEEKVNEMINKAKLLN